ncbi:MAG: hypothetical protein M3356_06545 [Actinomycetota bacterium]|nr:hypothetical protein [Actinomycetota bacterium]
MPPDGDLYAGAGPQAGTDEDWGSWSSRYGAPPPPPRGANLDFSALFVVLDALRRTAPAELQERLSSLIREALLTLRSLIDWYLERLDHGPREPRVEDIPID